MLDNSDIIEVRNTIRSMLIDNGVPEASITNELVLNGLLDVVCFTQNEVNIERETDAT